MTWVRLDDHFDEHPKFAQVGPLGMALWATGLAYSSRNGTRGFIPWGMAQRLVAWEFAGPQESDGRRRRYRVSINCGHVGDDVSAGFVIDLLVDAGLWEEVEGGYQIHDYDEYQPSPEALEELRQKRAEAGRRGGLAKVANAVASAKANAIAKPKQNRSPYPVPDPVPGEDPDISNSPVPTVATVTPRPAAAAAATAFVPFEKFSDGAQAVLNEWRRAHGKPRPPKLNPTQAAKLETAVVELGVDRLKESAIWSAERGIPEFDKCIRAAIRKRQLDEGAEAAPQYRNGTAPRRGGLGKQGYSAPDLKQQLLAKGLIRADPEASNGT